MAARLLLSIVLLTACAATDVPSGSDFVDDLPPCTPAPTPATPPVVPDGVVVPEGTDVVQVDRVPPLTIVVGYADVTPVQLRARLEAQAAADAGIQVVHAEDEGFEAELLVDADGQRTAVRITARCRTGSTVVLSTAPLGQTELLPVPGAARVGS